MKRRQLIRAGMGALGAAGVIALSPQRNQAQTSSDNPLKIEWLGHTAFLFSSNNRRILVNPFKPVGCTKGYPAPDVNADLVMISSQLFDEGGGVSNLPNDPRVLYEPGLYEFKNMELQGISMPHDREGGRRFGNNIAWMWQQAGLKILHFGGAAAPLEMDQTILMGRPDVVIVPVGGSPKAYPPELAKDAVETLKPKLVIPSHYLTAAANKDKCNLVGVEQFTKLFDSTSVDQLNGNQLSLTPNSLPEQMQVKVMQFKQQ